MLETQCLRLASNEATFWIEPELFLEFAVNPY